VGINNFKGEWKLVEAVLQVPVDPDQPETAIHVELRKALGNSPPSASSGSGT
jgi:hypothetical protein